MIHFGILHYLATIAINHVSYCMFLFLVINHSVAGVVCPVAGVILTVVEENHSVAVVACPVVRVMQNCVAQVTSKSTVIGSLVNCPFACRIAADHSLMRLYGFQSDLPCMT